MAEKEKQVYFTWKAHPAKQNSKKTTGAVFIIIILAFIVQFSFRSIFWSGFSVLVLVLALHKYFFPSSYCIDDGSISAKYLLGKKLLYWKNIRRFSYDANGGYLSTHKKHSILDAYRGMHLYFNGHRENIIHRIEKKIETIK